MLDKMMQFYWHKIDISATQEINIIIYDQEAVADKRILTYFTEIFDTKFLSKNFLNFSSNSYCSTAISSAYMQNLSNAIQYNIDAVQCNTYQWYKSELYFYFYKKSRWGNLFTCKGKQATGQQQFV